MTEKSWFWRGLVVGDAVYSRYDAKIIAEIWRKLFTTNRTEEGVIANVDNELEPSYTSSKSKVETGAALVDGKFYDNDVLIEMEGFGSADESVRYWRNVLRKSSSIYYVRTSISGPGDTAYPNLTQIEDDVWEIPISQYTSVAGALTGITDERVFAKSPLCQFINSRQGGSATIWSQTGSDKQSPGMPKIFAGARVSEGVTAAIDIVFPVEYLYPPIVLTTCVNVSMTHVRTVIATISETGWSGYTRNGDDTIAVSTQTFWLAIGPVA